MKKIIVLILCAGTLAISMAGCGYTDALADNSSSQTETTQAESNDATADEASSKKFDDTFDGLCNYFADKEYIANKDGKIDEKSVTEMDTSLIGAKNGKKFTTKYGGKAVTIELYEMDTNSDTAKDIIASIEKDGTFTILDLPAVTAYLSDNGKYLMIYTDESIKEDDAEDDNYKHREEVIENFKSFNK